MTARQRPVDERLALDGALWLTVGGASLAGQGRIGLLRAIAEQGSITRAAKAVQMSYKAAWAAVDAMNRLAGEPLVERVTGGRGGGSTRLTTRGARLVERYGQLDEVHHRFVQQLSQSTTDLALDLSLLKTLNMKTSARNQFVGIVTGLLEGAVNDEVQLGLPGGAQIVAIVTRDSTQQLGLRIGTPAFALVKSSSVMISTDLLGVRLSARNQWPGDIVALRLGAVNAEVMIEIAGGARIAATVTQSSVAALGLRSGQRATAIFKASSVILGVMA